MFLMLQSQLWRLGLELYDSDLQYHRGLLNTTISYHKIGTTISLRHDIVRKLHTSSCRSIVCGAVRAHKITAKPVMSTRLSSRCTASSSRIQGEAGERAHMQGVEVEALTARLSWLGSVGWYTGWRTCRSWQPTDSSATADDCIKAGQVWLQAYPTCCSGGVCLLPRTLLVTASFQSRSPEYRANGCSAQQWLHGWHHRLALPRLFVYARRIRHCPGVLSGLGCASAHYVSVVHCMACLYHVSGAGHRR